MFCDENSYSEKWCLVKQQFQELGGIAENVELREGLNGRGLFPLDQACKVSLVCPYELLVSLDEIEIRRGELIFIESSDKSTKIRDFVEFYYSSFVWNDHIRRQAIAFAHSIINLPEELKIVLNNYKLVDLRIFSLLNDENEVLKRFLSQRQVIFKGKRFLAPVWDLVNHSSFALPFRFTSNGLETPPKAPSNKEIVHKYSSMRSPSSMWNKYDFAGDGIVAYGFPLEARLIDDSFIFTCVGEQIFYGKARQNVDHKDHQLFIKSLPVGCISESLPSSYLFSILQPMGLNMETSLLLMNQIQEFNLIERKKIIEYLVHNKLDTLSELSKAITYEIDLIQNSVNRQGLIS